MYARVLRNAQHTRRFLIQPTSSGGWEVREEHDDRLMRLAHYSDWHRVERAQRSFTHEAVLLRDAGWVDDPYSANR
jgi:hypothetical protein